MADTVVVMAEATAVATDMVAMAVAMAAQYL